MPPFLTPLLSPAALVELLAAGRDLVVLDATTLLPGERFDPHAAFAEAHLPGAGYFDIEAFSDPEDALPHMVPSPARFARLMTALGVGPRSRVVFYDQGGVVSAARARWMLKLFGHDDVAVLDGGLPDWRAAGLPVEQGAAVPTPSAEPFVPRLRTNLLRGLGDMIDNLGTGQALVLDARSAGRFAGTAPEPRAGLAAGHIPGSRNLPFGLLLDEGRRFLPREQLRARFAARGVGPGVAVVTSCGSGLTAAVLTLGLAAAGLEEGALYDGSWAEWGSRPGLAVETGEGQSA